MERGVGVAVGVKSDPVEYRYSYDWLFRLMAEEGVRHLQLGSFFELYHLPDAYFRALRQRAQDHGVRVSSVFTSHRELGGFMREETGWVEAARRNYERLIEVGALLGARAVGSNPGTVLRDRMAYKAEAVRTYLDHMRELMRYAYDRGVPCLTMEPMSCLAEPPTLPDEIRAMAEELQEYHRSCPDTAAVGYCADVSHGYADETGTVRHSHLELLEATLPYLEELHLKNTDALFHSTFGFGEAERAKGVVDLAAVRDLLQARADVVPQKELVAYLEIGGPKLGRDYSDARLADSLRASLRHALDVFCRPRPMGKDLDHGTHGAEGKQRMTGQGEQD